MNPATATIAPPVTVTGMDEPGIEASQPCDLCDSIIEAGAAAAVLFYASSRARAHAECIDLIRLPVDTGRLL